MGNGILSHERPAGPGLALPEQPIRVKSVAPRGFFTRLSRLEPLKLALIALGVSFVILAPLLQFDSAPKDENLVKGFDYREAFGEGGLPHESGVLGMAAGGLPGQDTRVVTPGDFHDPLSLIRTGEERPSEPAAPAPAAPASAKSKIDWKDVLSGARQKDEQPKPRAAKPSFSTRVAGALKSMLSGFKASGGGGATQATLLVAKLERPSSEGLTSNRGSVQSSLSRIERERDYRGLSRAEGESLARQDARNRSTFDGTRGGGGPGGGLLRDALASSTGFGGAAASGGSYAANGDAEKFPGAGNNNSLYDRKVEDKESLGELAKKLNMQKSIDHKWKKREWNEIGKKQKQMEIKGQLANTALQGAFQLAGQALQALAGKGGGEGGGGSGGGSSGGGGGAPEANGSAVANVGADPRTAPLQSAIAAHQAEISAIKSNMNGLATMRDAAARSGTSADLAKINAEFAGQQARLAQADAKLLNSVDALDETHKVKLDGAEPTRAAKSVLDQGKASQATGQKLTDESKATEEYAKKLKTWEDEKAAYKKWEEDNKGKEEKDKSPEPKKPGADRPPA